MRLLLHLFALIAGFAGLVAGQPAAARAGEPMAIAASLAGSVEAASESAAVRHLPSTFASLAALGAERDVRQPVFVAQSHRVDERRIE